MALKIGSTSITKLYKGAIEVTKLYLGNVLVYTSSLYNAITTAYNTRALADSYTVESLPCVDSITDAFSSTPVLAMIPSGFKTSNSASILPNDGTGDFTVVRNSSKRRVNSSGLIETLGVNVIAPDYTDAGCPVIKIEPQSTNKIIYSNSFSNWNAFGGCVIQGGFLSPDGTNSATKLSGGAGGLNIIYSSTSANPDTRSIWARTVSGTGTANLCAHQSNTNGLFTITTTWQRFDIRYYNTSAQSQFYVVDFRGAGTLSELIIWEAQAEAINGDAPTSNITTGNGTATRFADVVSVNTASITGTITSITETIDGVDQTPITTIPANYTMPVGNINKIIME